MTAIMGYGNWGSNAELIANAVVPLGYLSHDGYVLDATYGIGAFWSMWKPRGLVAHDIDPNKAPDGPMDFRKMDYADGSFDAVVFDPPYKLNGRPDKDVDDRYGVGERTRWQDRHKLIHEGIIEMMRLCKSGGIVLIKCMDQVVSGQVRWQTVEFTCAAEEWGGRLEDRFDMLSYRPQPMVNVDGTERRQVHARRNVSTLLVVRKQ